MEAIRFFPFHRYLKQSDTPLKCEFRPTLPFYPITSFILFHKYINSYQITIAMEIVEQKGTWS